MCLDQENVESINRSGYHTEYTRDNGVPPIEMVMDLLRSYSLTAAYKHTTGLSNI